MRPCAIWWSKCAAQRPAPEASSIEPIRTRCMLSPVSPPESPPVRRTRPKQARAQAPSESKRPSLLYANLARDLRDGIREGHYPVGSLLPTELALSEQWGLSRQTVREAIRTLADEGLVSRKPGVGTRVLRPGLGLRFTGVHSTDELEQYAREVRLTIDSIEPVQAHGALATHLACREGSRWLLLRGRRYRDNGPTIVGLSEMYLRDDYPGIQRRLRQLSGEAIHALLERDYGEHVDEILQEVCAVAIAPADAQVLGVAPGSPGLEVRRQFRLRSGRNVLVGRVLHPADRFSYSTRLVRGADKTAG